MTPFGLSGGCNAVNLPCPGPASLALPHACRGLAAPDVREVGRLVEGGSREGSSGALAGHRGGGKVEG